MKHVKQMKHSRLVLKESFKTNPLGHRKEPTMTTQEFDQIKGRLLLHYSQKHPTEFIQYDAYSDGCVTGSIYPPTDGVTIVCSDTQELMDSPFVLRVLINHQVDHAFLVKALSQVLERVIKCPPCPNCGCAFGSHSMAYVCEEEMTEDEKLVFNRREAIRDLVATGKRNQLPY